MSIGRELKSFPINPAVLGKLTHAGFTYAGDLTSVKPSQLSTEANISPKEALEVLKKVFEDADATACTSTAPVTKSALQMLWEEQELGSIVTFSESLDDMLGGGVPLCKITEFCGAPGVGKTQICMQLAVDAHIPNCLGGVDAEVVYIDTEGSFILERMVDIAAATVEHCQCQLMKQDGAGDSLALTNFTVDKILASTYCCRCQDHVELIATVHLLPKFLRQHKKVKLVIVDSIASPFRHNFDDNMSVRTRLLTTLSQSFIKIATQFKVAVVLTNQMTTKIVPGDKNSHLIPALGESWAHASTIRVILFWEHNQRRALLYKSPNKKEATCSFQITSYYPWAGKLVVNFTLQEALKYDIDSPGVHSASAYQYFRVKLTTPRTNRIFTHQLGGLRDMMEDHSTSTSQDPTNVIPTPAASTSVNSSTFPQVITDTSQHPNPPYKRQRVT